MTVIMNCSNCKYDYFCCTKVRAPLEEDELDRFEEDLGLANRGIHVLRKIDGHCEHFDPIRKKCKIWDKRPKACRDFDCEVDEKLQTLVKCGRVVPSQPESPTNVKVLVSVAVANDDGKTKTVPMMIHSPGGCSAAQVVEIRGTPEEVKQRAMEAVQKILEGKLTKK